MFRIEKPLNEVSYDQHIKSFENQTPPLKWPFKVFLVVDNNFLKSFVDEIQGELL